MFSASPILEPQYLTVERLRLRDRWTERGRGKAGRPVGGTWQPLIPRSLGGAKRSRGSASRRIPGKHGAKMVPVTGRHNLPAGTAKEDG